MMAAGETRSRAGATPSADVLVYRVDGDGRLRSISDGVRALGHDPDALIGQPILDLVHADDRMRVRHLLHERRVGNRSVRGVTLRLLPASTAGQHDPRLYRFTVTGLYDRGGVFTGSRGVGHVVPAAGAELSSHPHQEDSPLGVLILDAHGGIRDGNLIAADLLQADPTALTGEPFARWLVEADRDALAEHLRDAVNAGKRAWFDTRLTVAGEERPLRVHLQATEWLRRDRQVTATLVDLTEAGSTASSGWQDAVEEVFQLTHDCVFFLEDGVIVDCNETAYHMFHADYPDMILGLRLVDLSEDEDDDRRRRLEDHLESARKGLPQRFHWSFARINGEAVSTNVTLTTLGDFDGRSLLAILQDTDSHDYRAQLHRTLLETGNQFLAMADPPGPEQLRDPLRRLANFFRVDRALLLRVGADGAGLVVDTAWPEEQVETGLECTLPLGQSELDTFHPVESWAVADRDEISDAETLETLARLGSASLAAVPFVREGRLLGALVFGHSRPRPWPAADMESVRLIASLFNALWVRRFRPTP